MKLEELRSMDWQEIWSYIFLVFLYIAAILFLVLIPVISIMAVITLMIYSSGNIPGALLFLKWTIIMGVIWVCSILFILWVIKQFENNP